MLHHYHERELDNYVQGVNAELAKVPTEVRSEMNEELARRFAELVTAHEELGLSRKQAIEAAMASLAAPRRAGQRLRRTYQERKLAPRTVRALRGTIAFTAACAFVQAVGIFAGGWGNAFLVFVFTLCALMIAGALHWSQKTARTDFGDTLIP